MVEDNKWIRPEAPPPPMFTGQPEIDFQKGVSDEIIDDIIGQEVLYFPIDMNRTQFHKLYKEAIRKVYLNPVRIKVLVEYSDGNTVIDKYTIDRRAVIKVHFPKRRLTEDQNMMIREGDIVFYNNEFHEIAKLEEPTMLYGHIDQKIEIVATCVKCRSAPRVSNRG